MNKELKQAIERIVLARINHENYGMFSRLKTRFEDVVLIRKNGIEISGDFIKLNGVDVGKIQRRHAAKKQQGMYKQLKPIISYE